MKRFGPTCHAGARGFESRRSHFERRLQIRHLPLSGRTVPRRSTEHRVSRSWPVVGGRIGAAWLTIAGLLLASASAAARPELDSAPAACPRLALTGGYAKSVDRALRAPKDVWGNALSAKPSGPTYEAVRRYVKPLLLARAPGRKLLTDSGFHYLPFSQPRGAAGSGSPMLHVADGSQIRSQRATGRRLTISAGRAGRERFGACLARLALPRLAAGFLPILETRYGDSHGVRYVQESFAAHVPGTPSLVSFIRLTADARAARGDVELQFIPSDGSAVVKEVPRGTLTTAHVAWSGSPAKSRLEVLDREAYEAARESVAGYWHRRLSEGMTVEVPEPRVRDAVRNLIIQNLGLTWRYSVGNPYQKFSFPEGVDVAQVMSSFGFVDVASAILRRSLIAPRGPYRNWRIGQKLVGAALHYRLFRDGSLIASVTPALRRDVLFLARQIGSGPGGLLRRERYSSDIPDLVYGLHSQAVAWQGLRAMGRVWQTTGRTALAARCRTLAARLAAGLRVAIRRSQRRLADGSLFIPVTLLDPEPAYRSLTRTRAGSYWNLVMPYALASGLFAPQSREARGVLKYMQKHGSRLLGLVRAGAYGLYGRSARFPVSGVNPVYGLNVARFLADNDRPDQLVLSLYGQLAAAMTPGTFVAGEAVSIAPLPGDYYRSTYLPPNGASNASFLETLKLMLVHETRAPDGTPRGLRLTHATPRGWLESGKRIVVRGAPTSFGPVSFSITSGIDVIRVSIDMPQRSNPPLVRLRLRLPRGQRITRVLIGGRPLQRMDRDGETIDLSGRTGRVELVATRR